MAIMHLVTMKQQCLQGGVLVTMKSLPNIFLPDFYDLIDVENFDALEVPSAELLHSTTLEVMDAHSPTVSAECTVLCAIGTMSKYGLSDLLVVEKGKLKELVSTVDLGGGFLSWIKGNASPIPDKKNYCTQPGSSQSSVKELKQC